MEKKYNVAIYLNAVMVCFGLVCTIIAKTSINLPAFMFLEVAMYLLICFYAFVGYKKPHGNLLRYLMFIFGLMLMARLHVCSSFIHETKCLILYTVSIALISYMSGRLNKIEKNKYITVVVLLMLVHCGHAQLVAETAIGVPITFAVRILVYTPAFMWIALSSAYFTRFLQHKEAGLTDK